MLDINKLTISGENSFNSSFKSERC